MLVTELSFFLSFHLSHDQSDLLLPAYTLFSLASLSSDLITLENHSFFSPPRRQSWERSASATARAATFATRKGDERRETRSALAFDRSASELCLLGRRVSEKEDGEEKEIFGLRPPDQEQGCQGQTRSGGGREHPGSGQAPAGVVGEDPHRPSRRERPLPPGSELQVLSSEGGVAGGAAGRA